jgi:hypothetical protein
VADFAGPISFQVRIQQWEMAWSMVFKALRTPAGFLLYTTDTMFYWLPAHAFRDAEEMERLAQMAQAKVERYEHVLTNKEANMRKDEICIRLQPAEALALFKWLARVDQAKLAPIERPERSLIQVLEGQLEKQLPGFASSGPPLVENAHKDIDQKR